MKKGNAVTLRGVMISSSDYELIKNFCTDVGIDDVPLRKNMFIETSLIYGFKRFNNQHVMPFRVSKLSLSVVDSMSGDGKVLMLVGESDDLEQFIADERSSLIEDNEEVISDEPMLAFVISSFFDEDGVDINKLAAQLWGYIPDGVVFDSVFSRYMTEEEAFDYVYDGIEPE